MIANATPCVCLLLLARGEIDTKMKNMSRYFNKLYVSKCFKFLHNSSVLEEPSPYDCAVVNEFASKDDPSYEEPERAVQKR